jgi:hypothetical protein
MKTLLKTEFKTQNGKTGNIITRKRTDGLYVTTFTPRLGLDFYSMDSDLKNSHETVKSFLRDIKGCLIKGEPHRQDKTDTRKRFIL